MFAHLYCNRYFWNVLAKAIDFRKKKYLKGYAKKLSCDGEAHLAKYKKRASFGLE